MARAVCPALTYGFQVATAVCLWRALRTWCGARMERAVCPARTSGRSRAKPAPSPGCARPRCSPARTAQAACPALPCGCGKGQAACLGSALLSRCGAQTANAVCHAQTNGAGRTTAVCPLPVLRRWCSVRMAAAACHALPSGPLLWREDANPQERPALPALHWQRTASTASHALLAATQRARGPVFCVSQATIPLEAHWSVHPAPPVTTPRRRAQRDAPLASLARMRPSKGLWPASTAAWLCSSRAPSAQCQRVRQAQSFGRRVGAGSAPSAWTPRLWRLYALGTETQCAHPAERPALHSTGWPYTAPCCRTACACPWKSPARWASTGMGSSAASARQEPAAQIASHAKEACFPTAHAPPASTHARLGPIWGLLAFTASCAAPAQAAACPALKICTAPVGARQPACRALMAHGHSAAQARAARQRVLPQPSDCGTFHSRRVEEGTPAMCIT